MYLGAAGAGKLVRVFIKLVSASIRTEVVQLTLEFPLLGLSLLYPHLAYGVEDLLFLIFIFVLELRLCHRAFPYSKATAKVH